MRIKKLSLSPYGQFRHLDLDFPERGIVFLFGLNGAGKTTIRQAILDLMFGMPARSSANWSYAWKFDSAVKIQATLTELRDADSLEVLRKRSGEDSLARQDGLPVAEDPFRGVVGGRSQELFAGLFSLSHQEIRKFSDELAEGGADREALVFGSGVGGSPEILTALKSLEAEADDLFPKSGRGSKEIQVTVDSLKERLADAQELKVPSPDWVGKARERSRLESEDERLEQKKVELERNLNSKRRYLEILPDIRVLQDLREKEATDRSTPDPEDALIHVVGRLNEQVALAENQITERAAKEAEREQVDTDSIIESLGAPTSGPKPDPEALITMSPPDLVATYLSDGISSQAVDPTLRTGLQELLERIAQLKFFEHEGLAAFRALLPGLPDRAVVQDFLDRESELRAAESRLRERIEDRRDKCREKEKDLNVLSRTTSIPTKDELAEARRFRDSAWQAIRSAWLAGDQEPGEAISRQANGEELPVVFELAVSSADAMADRRSEVAQEANRAEALRAEIEALTGEEEDLSNELEALGDAHAELLGTFREEWDRVDGLAGLDEPLVIKAMDDWLNTVSEIANDEKELYERVKELQEDLRRESESVDRLSNEIDRLSTPIDRFVEEVIADLAEKLGDEVDSEDPGEVVAYVRSVHQDFEDRKLLRERIRDLEATVVGQGQQNLTVLERETKDLDPDELKAEISRLEGELEETGVRRQEARDGIEEIIAWQATTAAGKSVRKTEYEARVLEENLREQIQRFIRLRMAVTVLERAQKAYTSRAAGPVLERAIAILSAMTGGLFTEFVIEKKSKKERLLVKRVDAQDVAIQHLSDGERDALAFALRVATLEHLIGQLPNEDRPPVIFDDALVNLDDEMAERGLSSLLSLAESTQVLFLTHHRHMLELAEQALDDSDYTELEVKSPEPEGVVA